LKVDYDLKPVQKEAVWEPVLIRDSLWAFPKRFSYVSRLRDVVKMYGIYHAKAKRLRKWLLKEFEENEKYKLVYEASYGQAVFDYNSVDLKELPKISFVTSVYNGEEHFEGFMEDITNQTIFKEKCELIMIDCNSEQNEKEMVKPWLEKYPDNIKYIKVKEDPGIYGAWNKAIKKAKGEFISNANLDDRHSPEFAEKLGKFLFAHKDVDCVYTENYLTSNPNETFENNSANGQVYPAEEFSKEALLRGNPPHCMPMWKKSLHDENGYFSEDYRSASDWEFWLRCCFKSGAKYKKLNEKLGLYYFNPKGMSTNKENNEWKRKEEREVFKTYFKMHKDAEGEPS